MLDRFEMLEVWDAQGLPLRIDATIFTEIVQHKKVLIADLLTSNL